VPTIRQLARLCALAVDNASLYREATEAVRVREEFLAATSHELRTPLSEIKGFVTTLLRTDAASAPRQPWSGPSAPASVEYRAGC
jgi:signal transduction histidine kinase